MASRKGVEHAANIMDALSASGRPLSAYALLDHLRPTGVAAPLTIYRALEKLMKSGKVHRIESLNAFVACKGSAHHDHSHPHGHDHTVAFTICDACGAVDEFADPRLCDRINESLLARGFVSRDTTLEVRGTCSTCKTTSASRPQQQERGSAAGHHDPDR